MTLLIDTSRMYRKASKKALENFILMAPKPIMSGLIGILVPNPANRVSFDSALNNINRNIN